MKTVLRLISLTCLTLVLMAGLSEVKAQVSNGRIAFVRGGDIYTADNSGTNALNLTNTPGNDDSPEWSPDGSKIVFVSERDGNSEIYVMNQNGSNQLRLTTTAAYEFYPAFSPDGTKIIFDRDSEIYTINTDGTNLIQITNNTVADAYPRFSPDGSKIVFSRRVQATGLVSIHIMNADGSNAVQISSGVGAENDSLASFSPDGTKIVFRRFDPGSFRAQFITINTDGSGLVIVYDPQTNFPAIWKPSYSPDGTYIIYSEQYEVNPTRHRIRAVGGGLNINDAQSPAWQPVRPVISHRPFDFDGDGKTDISIFRPSNGQWWVLRSSDGSHFVMTFGVSTDKIVPADYTGDGKTDIAVWRPSTGEWFVLRSEDNSYYSFPFGISTDIPIPADYDGDGFADPAIYRPSTSTWYLLKSLEGLEIATFGSAGDIPANADYDGDGKSDISIRRVTEWWIRRSSDSSVYVLPFSSADPPSEVGVPGDYTGDGEADLAVHSIFEGHNWKFRSSENGSIHNWYDLVGIPAPGDYDGDQKMDRAMFNPNTGVWFILYASGGFSYTAFGANGDVPTPNAYVR